MSLQTKAKALAEKVSQKTKNPMIAATGVGSLVDEIVDFVVEVAKTVDSLQQAVAKDKIGGNMGAG